MPHLQATQTSSRREQQIRTTFAERKAVRMETRQKKTPNEDEVTMQTRPPPIVISDEPIGKGTFGTVYSARRGGVKVVVKHIKKEGSQAASNEIRTLNILVKAGTPFYRNRRLQSPYEGIFIITGLKAIPLPLWLDQLNNEKPSGSNHQHLGKIVAMSNDLYRAINWLLNLGIYHLDIKPNNIVAQVLYDEKGPWDRNQKVILRIIDFGSVSFSTPVTDDNERISPSPFYMLPTLLQNLMTSQRPIGLSRNDAYYYDPIFRTLLFRDPANIEEIDQLVTKSTSSLMRLMLYASILPPRNSDVMQTVYQTVVDENFMRKPYHSIISAFEAATGNQSGPSALEYVIPLIKELKNIDKNLQKIFETDNAKPPSVNNDEFLQTLLDEITCADESICSVLQDWNDTAVEFVIWMIERLDMAEHLYVCRIREEIQQEPSNAEYIASYFQYHYKKGTDNDALEQYFLKWIFKRLQVAERQIHQMKQHAVVSDFPTLFQAKFDRDASRVSTKNDTPKAR